MFVRASSSGECGARAGAGARRAKAGRRGAARRPSWRKRSASSGFHAALTTAPRTADRPPGRRDEGAASGAQRRGEKSTGRSSQPTMRTSRTIIARREEISSRGRIAAPRIALVKPRRSSRVQAEAGAGAEQVRHVSPAGRTRTRTERGALGLDDTDERAQAHFLVCALVACWCTFSAHIRRCRRACRCGGWWDPPTRRKRKLAVGPFGHRLAHAPRPPCWRCTAARRSSRMTLASRPPRPSFLIQLMIAEASYTHRRRGRSACAWRCV